MTYSPTFTVTDIELTSLAQPVVLNSGTASIGWHNRSVRVVVSESASYGWENLAYFVTATPVAGQTIAAGQSQSSGQMGQATAQGPGQTSAQSVGQTGTAPTVPVQLFPFGSSSSRASVQLAATRSLTVSMSGGYSVSGNLAGTSQAAAVYPEQFGPSANASVGYAASPADSLITTATAQETTTPAGVCASGAPGQFCREVTPVISVGEALRHGLSGSSSIYASLGVSATVYQLSTGRAWGILPVGGVTYSKLFGAPPKDAYAQIEGSGLRISAELAPTVNVFTGSPSTRIQMTATVTEHVAPDITLRFLAGALETVPLPRADPSPLTVLNGGVDLRMRITRFISASVGLQAFWQTQKNVGVLPTEATVGPSTSASEVGYVALTMRLPTLRL